MRVIRPLHILGTPRKIAQELGWKLRKYPNPKMPNRVFSYTRDFMMVPVKPEHLVNAPVEYGAVYQFAFGNKYHQRKGLENNGIPVPKAAASYAEAQSLSGDKFVVRPLRHSGGMGYRVTSDRLDFTPGTQYISELFPKRREYRVIFVFGQPLIWLRKKPHEGISNEAPWGSENSFFQTINDVSGCRLASTDCVPRLSGLSVVSTAHIVAADVLLSGGSSGTYAVLELNFCPGLDIDNNRAKVVEVIRGRL